MALNAVIESIYQEGASVNCDGEVVSLDRSAMPREDVELLYRLASECDCEGDTLEVGMAFGLSTLALCQAQQERGTGRHIAIDPYQTDYFQSAGLENLKKAHLDNLCDFIPERSHLALPRLCAEGRQLSLGFIDGNHRFEQTFLDFFYIDRMLKVGGFIMFHDTWMPAIRKVLSLIFQNHSDSYEPARTYLAPALNWKGQTLQFIQQAMHHPWDAIGAKALVGEVCPHFMVLQKIAHLSDGAYDERWDGYVPF